MFGGSMAVDKAHALVGYGSRVDKAHMLSMG